MSFFRKSVDRFREIVDRVSDILELMLAVLFAITMFFTFVLNVATVSGDSMEPTLKSGDKVFVTVLSEKVRNGDIVVINCKKAVIFDDDNALQHRRGLGKDIVKRVIAVAGQEINIDFKAGTVSVNGVLLEEPYVAMPTNRDLGAFSGKYPFIVPAGYVFVMGDNRGISRDSRDRAVGLVSCDSIVGKVIMRYSPLNRLGFV